MLWDPRFATGANASAVVPSSSEKDGIPSSVGLAQIDPKAKKDRRWHQDIPGVNKVAPGHGWSNIRFYTSQGLMSVRRQGMGAQTAS